MPLRRYAAKLLLFGEYAVIHGSPALSIPISVFSGSWDQEGNSDWWAFIDHLKKIDHSDLPIQLNIEKLNQDAHNGFSFESSIPQGYGLGSSAALSAAFFDTYFDLKEKLDLYQLRYILARIEDFFHGTSSGIDALVSYLNAPIHILKDESLELFDRVSKTPTEYVFYLYDTNQQRNTKLLVEKHNSRFKTDNIYQSQIDDLKRYNEAAIRAMMCNDSRSLISAFYKISDKEYEAFYTMIPEHIIADYKSLKLKFCGAGGGGYFLGVTTRDKISSLSDNYPITRV